MESPARNVMTENVHYESRESLLSDVSSLMETWTGKTLILGGHFRLCYRHAQKRFVPLMPSVALKDPAAEPTEKEQLKDIGDFPEVSFELSVALVKSQPARIVLLVDDDQFRRFQDGPAGEELARRRRLYYRSDNPLPKSYEAILDKNDTTEIVLERNDVDRVEESTLPSKTVFLSEHALKKNFNRNRKKWLLKQPGFSRESGAFASQRLVYCGLGNVDLENACFIDDTNDDGDHAVTCSSTAIELLLDMANKGASNIILIVPFFCKIQVDLSVRATLESLVQFDNVIAIWGDRHFQSKKSFGFGSATRYRVASQDKSI